MFFQDILGYDTLPKNTLNKDGQLIGDTTAPTVNPLQLPYFMAATVGKIQSTYLKVAFS